MLLQSENEPGAPFAFLAIPRTWPPDMSDQPLITRFAHYVILSSGWRRYVIAFLAGSIAALGLAPLNILPAFVVSLTIAAWLIDGSTSSRASGRQSMMSSAWMAAKAGWWFGFGYFVAGLWWLGAAFLVEADEFAWALPLGVIGMPACLAIFPAMGFFLSQILWSGHPGRIFAFATGIGLSEWLRGVAFTGFPWNDFGMALGGNLVLAQAASVIGLHGLTFVAVAIAAAPATLIDSREHNGKRNGLFWRPAVVATIALGLVSIFGFSRLAQSKTEFVDGVRLRLVQPNVSQGKKFRPEAGMAILDGYLKLSDRSTSPQSSGVANVTHLFWPESPFPFLLSENAEALARIGRLLPQGAYLVTGAARAERNSRAVSRHQRRKVDYFNSIQLVDSNGVITQTYDKVHLVPFGEYLPFGAFFDRIGIRQFVHIPGGFSAGKTQKQMMLPKIGNVIPLICYEAIFPESITAGRGQVASGSLMVNLTNDGWFGPTSGPYQHLAQARLRTIEQGIPMVRVANTGVSAVIDPAGRILQSLRLGVEGVIDTGLPRRREPTLFSRYGWLLSALIAGLCLLGAMLTKIRKPH